MSNISSRDWTVEGVLQKLRRTAPGKKASIQVFLRDGVASSKVQKTSEKIVNSVDPIHSSKMGRVRSLSKSFSIEGEVDVLERIAHHPDVKAILPSQVEDIYPKPITKTK
jgi:hypothetical protein